MAITITNCNSMSAIRKMYEVSFFDETIIDTTVTDNPTAVADWIEDIKYLHHLPELIVGLDVEWRPSFSQRQNPVAVLQLCVDDQCLVYQIIHSGQIPQSLVDFLSRDFNFITFVGVGIKSDLEKLQSDYGFGGEARYVDLRGLAARSYNRNELRNAGLKELGRVVLGKEVEKPEAVRMGRWDQRRLTEEQVQYACLDAFMAFMIGKLLGANEY